MKITWLGHSAFALEFSGGEILLLDPWTEGNPAAPKDYKLSRVDGIAVSHGHSDHVTGVIPLAQKFSAPVVAIYELGGIFEKKGVEKTLKIGKGGTADLGFASITAVNAFHSSSYQDGDQTLYAGEPAGFIIRPRDGGPVIYFAGDTAVFGDMALIAEIYKPEIAMLPIGGNFTMDPHEASHAVRLLKVKRVIPMHYGTFPVLTGTPEHLEKHVSGQGVQVLKLTAGQTESL